MAQKRRLEVPRKVQEDESEDEGPGWKDWFLRDYARYWYWIAMGFLNILIYFQLQWSFGVDWKVALFLAGLAAATQGFAYIRIWGSGGPLDRQE